MKKILFIAAMLLLPFGVKAECDLSVKHIKSLSQSYLDRIYTYNPLGLKKPRLVVSPKKVKGYYAKEFHGIITIYPKSFKEFYCDQYFDGLTPFVAEVVAHEYTHFLDENIRLSKKIGEKEMSEKTANIGERVFTDLIGYAKNFNGYSTGTKSSNKKYAKFMHIIKI